MARHKRSLCARLPPEPGHIPELLLDTAVPLSEEAPVGPAAPRPPDLPEDPIDMSTQPGELPPPSRSPSVFSALFTVTLNEEEQPPWYCTPSDLPQSFIVKLHFFFHSQSSHRARVRRPEEERTRRTRSRSGSGSGSRGTSRGRGSRRRRERGSCRSWRDWREKRWASYCTCVP